MPEVTSLKSETMGVGRLFSGDQFYRIPEYQRPFQWDESQLQDLVDDLKDADRKRQYFLGTLVLHKTDDGYYDVVDGQQRLTALNILLACVRDMDVVQGDEEPKRGIDLKLRQAEQPLEGIPGRDRLTVRDQELFQQMVQTPGGTTDGLKGLVAESPTGKRYEAARRIFRKALVKYDGDELRSFTSFILQNCVVIFLATNSFEDSYRLFSVVNDRGKQLRRVDILKANNLSSTAITNPDTRRRYAQKWEELEEQLGEKEFEQIFHLLRLIYTKEKPKYDLFREFDEIIFPSPESPSRGRDFIDKVTEAVQLYDSIFIAKDYLDSVSASESHRFRSLIHIMSELLPAYEWRAILMFSAMKYEREGFYQLVKNVEGLSVEHWVRGVRKDERFSSISSILKRIANSTDISWVGEVKFNRKTVSDSCRVTNFYGAGYAKYLLLRAELQATEMDRPHYLNARSIEHVLPVSPRVNSEWVKKFTVEQMEELINLSGNLVLLSKAKNSSASNNDFKEKKARYLKNRVSDYPRSVEVLNYENWTPQIIRQRTDAFANSALSDF